MNVLEYVARRNLVVNRFKVANQLTLNRKSILNNLCRSNVIMSPQLWRKGIESEKDVTMEEKSKYTMLLVLKTDQE